MISTPLERLAALSAQRTARTDRLHEAARALLAQLGPFVDLNESFEVAGCSLVCKRIRSNVGYADTWRFTHVMTARGVYRTVDLDRPLDDSSYLHGDYRFRWVGPTRVDLVAFAIHAVDFVNAILAKLSNDLEEIEDGAANVSSAITKLEEAV